MDMTASEPIEQVRIMQNKGDKDDLLEIKDDEMYLKGMITNTRGLGDLYLKIQSDEFEDLVIPKNFKGKDEEYPYLSALPDVIVYLPQKTDKCIVLGTSHIWKHLDQDIVAKIAIENENPQVAADLIIDEVKKSILGGK